MSDRCQLCCRVWHCRQVCRIQPITLSDRQAGHPMAVMCRCHDGTHQTMRRNPGVTSGLCNHYAATTAPGTLNSPCCTWQACRCWGLKPADSSHSLALRTCWSWLDIPQEVWSRRRADQIMQKGISMMLDPLCVCRCLCIRQLRAAA